MSRTSPGACTFHGTIVTSTLIGIAINLTGLDSPKALFSAAVIDNVVAVPLMAVMMIMAVSPTVMGRFTLPPGLCFMGSLCTAAMAAAVVTMFATW